MIGHSWGGFLASLYAAEFPQHVQALILVSPANMLVMPQPDAGSDLFASVRARLPVDQQPEYDAFMKEYFDFNGLFTRSDADLVAMNETFGRYYISVIDLPADALIRQGEPGGWMVWGMYASLGQRDDYRAALRKVEAPVQVIHGADDLQSAAVSRLYSDTFPHAQFAVIAHAGHFSFQQQRARFAQIVKEFLEALRYKPGG